MQEALAEARCAFVRGEVPVGAILVVEGVAVARAHNRVEEWADPTAHAEVLCLRAAAAQRGNWRLLGATLYVTREPCAMCAGALLSARARRLVWGAPDRRVGAGGSWVDLLTRPHPIHTLEVQGGVCAEEASALMTRFFRERRTCISTR